MSDSDIWSVDCVAATNLFANLGLRLSDEDMNLVARHFAQHRYNSYGWAADRVHASITQMLESESATMFQLKPEAWTEGYLQAEQLILAASPRDLLKMDAGRARTKGQVLRALVRRARAKADSM